MDDYHLIEQIQLTHLALLFNGIFTIRLSK